MSKLVRKKKHHMLAPVLILVIALALGLGGTVYLSAREAAEAPRPTAEPVAAPRVGDVAAKAPEQEQGHLREDKSIYADTSEWYEVETLYLTVRPGNPEDGTDHSWAEVNAHDVYYYQDLGIERYACEAILQAGDESGPVEGEFGYGASVPNATVCVRGQTSSQRDQKNYKIRIKDGMGLYKDMQTVPINKVQSDVLRFRNKMTFDLMQAVPQMTAIRTQFVHLYVKDETEGGSGAFEDYGLYTRLEQMNKRYLENHGLDSKGQLYKVNEIFEWYAYEPLMKLESDPSFDLTAFEHHLKVKGDRDHGKLQEVLRAVNDHSIPIEETVERYFDVENIAYYIAFHILDGNHDIGGRNLYIYSPLNSEKFYLLSWDCDGCFEYTQNKMFDRSWGQSWERGMTKYVGVVLYNRFFRVKAYRDAISAAVEDLKANYFTQERVRERAETCARIVLPYVQSEPDSENWDIDAETFNAIVQGLPLEVDKYYQEYLRSLEEPWPFFVALPEYRQDGQLRLSWGASYDLDNERVTYSCILATDPDFVNVIAREEDLRVPELYCEAELEPGVYFIRVQATNESGYTQDCFDVFTHNKNVNGKEYGCKAVTLQEDGTFREYDDDIDGDGGDANEQA